MRWIPACVTPLRGFTCGNDGVGDMALPMTLVSGIVTYFLIWWTALFAVLPWGLRRDETGKPEMPDIRRKFLITTGVSLVIWIGVYMAIKIDIIDFRAIARTMIEEDTR